MPELFWTTARTRFLNLEEVRNKIIECVKSLQNADKRVKNVILFGSLTKGNYTPHSDVDLLIILKEDSRRIIDRIPCYMDYFADIPFGIDVFPYTEEELEKMKNEGNKFISDILANGTNLTNLR